MTGQKPSKPLRGSPRYIVGDSRHVLIELPISPTCTITSPPYFNVRKYPANTQLGHGQNLGDFRRDVRFVFDLLYRKTKPGGTLWVVADSIRQNGRLLPLPAYFTEAATLAGWSLQSSLVWQKDRTYPWLEDGRLRKLHELLLLFTKGDSIHLRVDRIREVNRITEWWLRYPERYNPLGRAPGDVWFEPIPVQGSWGKGFLRHECPFPPRLVERIVELSTDTGDLVLDPFAGTGVVAAVAHEMRRKGLAIDVSETFAHHFREEVRPVVKEWWAKRQIEREETGRQKDAFFRANIGLRVLKMGRLIAKRLTEQGVSVGGCWIKTSRLRHQMPWALASVALVLSKGDSEEALRKGREALTKPPLSKFGIEIDLRAFSVKRFWSRGKALAYHDSQPMPKSEVDALEFRVLCENSDAPVVATNMAVDVDDLRMVNTKFWRNRLPPPYLREDSPEYMVLPDQTLLWSDL